MMAVRKYFPNNIICVGDIIIVLNECEIGQKTVLNKYVKLYESNAQIRSWFAEVNIWNFKTCTQK